MFDALVFKLISLAETGINIHTDYEYVMEQVKFAENLKETNAKTAATFTIMMVMIFIVTFIVTVFPIAPTLIILAAPAILMNLGWLVFARAV